MPPPSARPARSSPDDGALDYLLLGHVTVDRVDARRVLLGGTATYASLTVAGLGGRAAIHTSASYEPALVNPLSVRGIRIARIPAAYTTCFVNQYDEQGRRQQTIESVAERLTYDQLLPEWRHPPLVHFAPLCQELDAALVDRFPKSLIGVTPQGWMRAWGDDGLVHAVEWADADRVLARADAVVISVDDVADQRVIHDWARKARLLVVTRADQGCDVYRDRGRQTYHAPAFRPARETDPTGAGDVFAAAYFWHLLRSDGDWRTAADWANCVASFAVEKQGIGGVPKLDDVEKRWQSGARIGAPVGAAASR